MSGPWERYAAPSADEAAPWAKYRPTPAVADAPSADDFLGAGPDAAAGPNWSARLAGGRGASRRPPPRPVSVLQDVVLPEPQFNEQAAARDSIRANVEIAPPTRTKLTPRTPTRPMDPASDLPMLAKGAELARLQAVKALGGGTQFLGDILPGDAGEAVAQFGANAARVAGQRAEPLTAATGPVDGFAPGSVVNDLQRVTPGAISSVLTMAGTGGAFGAGRMLSGLAGLTAGQEYAEGRAAGLDVMPAATRAGLQALFEYGGERLGGMDRVADSLGAVMRGSGAADVAGRALTGAALREVPSEEFTTVGQWLVDKAPGIGLNQDSTASDLGAQMKDTALASLVTSGMVGGPGVVMQARARPALDPAALEALQLRRDSEPTTAGPLAALRLARAIEQDSQAFADDRPPVVVQQPVARAVAAPLAPSPAPEPQPAPAPPALPYDPSVKPAEIMVAGTNGEVRPMTADEFLAAEDTIRKGEETGLTPDVRRAQDARSEPEPVRETPDLVRRLLDAGWKPPEDTDASQAPAAVPDTAASPDAQPETAGQQGAGVARLPGDAGANRADAGGADPALTPAAESGRLAEQADLHKFANSAPAEAAPQPARPEIDLKPLATRPVAQPESEAQFSRAARTVDVDGTPRPAENSKGQPVGRTPEEQQNFHRWFGQSKAVDEQGRPLVVYHGTGTDFSVFRPSDIGMHFGTTAQANDRAGRRGDGSQVMPVYLRMGNPLRLKDARSWADPVWAVDSGLGEHLSAGLRAEIGTLPRQYRAIPDLQSSAGQAAARALADGVSAKIRAELEAAGYDGIVYANTHDGESLNVKMASEDSYIVFSPEQIKSATGNNGQFDQADPDIRKSGQQFRGPAPGPQAATSTASSMRTELRGRFGDVIDRLENRGFLKLWDSTDDYNAAGQASKLPADARGVQGMFHNGVAHLFGDGVERGNAVAVLLHEVGEHASMKAMLGDRYKDLVRRAYQLVREGDETAEMALMRIPEDTAAKHQDSELLAYLIEETASREAKASPAARSILRDAIAAIRAWFYQTGFAKNLERYGVRLELTPKDIAALAVRAVNWQAEQGAELQAQGEPAPAFSSASNPAQAAASVFGTATGPQPAANLGAQPWTVAEPGTWDNTVRAIQNNKIDLKRVRDAIEQQFGRMHETNDAYLAEELYHGRVAARVEKLHKDSVEPILRKIAVAGKDHGVTLDDVNRYLHALHAPERNAAMAAINPGMANNKALSGMSDADAAQAIAAFRQAGKEPALRAIAADVHQLLADTRTALVADGLEEAGVIQAWEQAYQNYVPLQRDVEDRPRRGQGFSVRGPEAKRAVGSNREAVNILANVVTQAETAAIRAEKAEVGRTLLAMAEQYPNPDFWKVDTPPTKPRVNPHTGLVERSAVDPLYQTADNVVMVKDFGAVRFIVFNKDNARALEVAKAMKNLEVAPINRLLEFAGKGTRFMASLLTQRNPEFWLTNFARDIQGSMLQMSGTDAEGLQGKVMGNLPKAMAGMRDAVRGTGSGQWARYAQELRDAGGTTGYMQMFENSDVRMKDLQREVDRMNQGKADPRRVFRQVIDFIDDYNEVIENGMRLAVFQAARDAGVSTARAASIAKNVTVNFNRKGNLTPTINSLYMFFNAGIQGTARLAQAVTTSNSARIAVGSMAATAFIMDIVNRALAGEDDETKRNRYDLIAEHEKARNWIFMNPARQGEYIKVPLPIGFNVFHNAGRLMADAMFRKDPRNAAEYGLSFAASVLDAFSPLGTFGSVGQLIAPTLADPVLQVAENRNFAGSPVYKSDDRGFGKTDPKPAYTRHFDSTPDAWKQASKALNDITGGDKVKPGLVDVEPDLLRFVYTTLTGGPGRALDRTVDAAQANARGEKVAPARYPLVSRFYGSNDDRQRDAAYYTDLKRANDAKAQFDYFTKSGRRDLALEAIKRLGDGDVAKGRRLIAEAERAKKDDRAINRQLRQLAERQADGADVIEQMSALKARKRAGHHRVLSSTANEDDE